jgi:hypothetical protein
MRGLIRVDTAQLSQAVGEAVDAYELSERVALAADNACPRGADLIIDRGLLCVEDPDEAALIDR